MKKFILILQLIMCASGFSMESRELNDSDIDFLSSVKVIQEKPAEKFSDYIKRMEDSFSDDKQKRFAISFLLSVSELEDLIDLFGMKSDQFPAQIRAKDSHMEGPVSLWEVFNCIRIRTRLQIKASRDDDRVFIFERRPGFDLKNPDW